MGRSEWTERIVNVRHVVQSFGRTRENPPSLGHLREFVELCADLPDDTKVTIEQGRLDEGGRHTVTFSVRIVEKLEHAGGGSG